ncbi:PREDICTED: protein UPSTREAM OF FLC-like [Nicotiana attenuata]|uniref:Protein upstream of flc n=1 Tax=Nicotiana attenuata TaxID=49451 RepID=A0A1J6KCB5_NICAT|nr:PREDICTED: protein UPSTREAM OF FLC-like [Nicotiana attenuata]OIT20459.1 protein upstream of flc [Nicotiana attenuata]
MEERMKKYRQLSPERAKVWTEKSPKYVQQQPQKNDGKVPVVYYLCRNQRLEHPHFMEVPLSSPDGLYLRDVIERFNVLRGRGMASSYSWSCKRSYKNRFVWHDLCEDDLILPAHGNEYVLKGSELCEESNSGHCSPAKNDRLSNPKVLPEPSSSRSQDNSFPSSSTDERCSKNYCKGEPSVPIPGSLNVTPESRSANCSSCNGSLRLKESKINNTVGLADASNQTQENGSRANAPRDTCRKGVSTTNESADICMARHSAAPAPSSKGGRTDTLISLIRSDVSKLSSFKTLESEEGRVSSAKLKPSNMLMQLISCGSVSVADHRFGLIHTYKSRLCLGKLDCLKRNQRLMGLEDEEYFCGSWMEPTLPKERVPPALKRSSFAAERTNGDAVEDKKEPSSTRSKCMGHSTKASLNNNLPNNESIRSPLSESPRTSSEGEDTSRTIASGISPSGRKRITELSQERNIPRG